MEKWLLITAAIAPAIVLGGYVYKKDRVEKEPLGLLILIFGLGSLSCFPASFLESVFDEFIIKLMGENAIVIDGEVYLASSAAYYTYQVLIAFLEVAFVEEVCKWFAMKSITVKHREFDNLFDGIIYGAFASLGFATLENIMYVLKFGWHTAFARAFLSVPGHLFYGVIMGYYYSLWHTAKKANALEKKLKFQGKILQNGKEISYKRFACLSVIVPTICHGAYDLCCFIGGPAATVALLVIVGILYIYCFSKIKRMSSADGSIKDCYINVILKKYPYLTADVSESDAEIVEKIAE